MLIAYLFKRMWSDLWCKRWLYNQADKIKTENKDPSLITLPGVKEVFVYQLDSPGEASSGRLSHWDGITVVLNKKTYEEISKSTEYWLHANYAWFVHVLELVPLETVHRLLLEAAVLIRQWTTFTECTIGENTVSSKMSSPDREALCTYMNKLTSIE